MGEKGGGLTGRLGKVPQVDNRLARARLARLGWAAQSEDGWMNPRWLLIAGSHVGVGEKKKKQG